MKQVIEKIICDICGAEGATNHDVLTYQDRYQDDSGCYREFNEIKFNTYHLDLCDECLKKSTMIRYVHHCYDRQTYEIKAIIEQKPEVEKKAGFYNKPDFLTDSQWHYLVSCVEFVLENEHNVSPANLIIEFKQCFNKPATIEINADGESFDFNIPVHLWNKPWNVQYAVEYDGRKLGFNIE